MKQKLFFAVLIGLIVGACNKPPTPDKSDDSSGPSPYAGSWTYTEVTLSNGTLKMAGQNVGTFTGTGSDIKGGAELTEDPDRYTSEIEFTANLDVMVFQQMSKQQAPSPKQTSEGTWNLTNGVLTLNPDDAEEIEVVSHSPTKMVLKGNFNQTINAGQFTFDSNADVEFVLEKDQ